jgi:chorismate synthase
MLIEKDEARIVSGIRFGRTMGSPVTFIVENRDYKNWEKRMSADPRDRGEAKVVTRPRPGHADLAGVLKYNLEDIRDVLERASARETTARVAIGAFARQLLAPFGVQVLGYVASIGSVQAKPPPPAMSLEELARVTEDSQVRVADPEAERAIIAEIDECKKEGDTLGGIVEVVAAGLPVGLGSHVQWDRKLDGRLAHALLSLQAVKGVEVGIGFEAARVRVAFKPLSTLMRPLKSADIKTKAEAVGAIERSDVCAIPAAAVIAETVVAFELANAFLEKFGGDSLTEITNNYRSYLEQVRNF